MKFIFCIFLFVIGSNVPCFADDVLTHATEVPTPFPFLENNPVYIVQKQNKQTGMIEGSFIRVGPYEISLQRKTPPTLKTPEKLGFISRLFNQGETTKTPSQWQWCALNVESNERNCDLSFLRNLPLYTAKGRLTGFVVFSEEFRGNSDIDYPDVMEISPVRDIGNPFYLDSQAGSLRIRRIFAPQKDSPKVLTPYWQIKVMEKSHVLRKWKLMAE